MVSEYSVFGGDQCTGQLGFRSLRGSQVASEVRRAPSICTKPTNPDLADGLILPPRAHTPSVNVFSILDPSEGEVRKRHSTYVSNPPMLTASREG